MKPLILFLVHLLISIPVALLRAYTGATLWLWFIVPTFHVQPISKTAAYGIAWLLAVLHQYHGWRPKEETRVELMLTTIADSVFLCLLALFSGWIARRWL